MMRLWHYRLIPFLPDSQLKGQWRELNLIFKADGEVNHILINYIREYPRYALAHYADMVLREMARRGYRSRDLSAMERYLSDVGEDDVVKWSEENGRSDANPFPRHHTDRYLVQCFWNLAEKFDRGQRDFSKGRYDALAAFVAKYMD